MTKKNNQSAYDWSGKYYYAYTSGIIYVLYAHMRTGYTCMTHMCHIIVLLGMAAAVIHNCTCRYIYMLIYSQI